MMHRAMQKPTLTEWGNLSPAEQAHWLAWDVYRQRQLNRVSELIRESNNGTISPEVFAILAIARLT